MNSNNNSNSCDMNAKFYQDWYLSFPNEHQTTKIQQIEHVQEENQNTMKNKCLGNRKLLSYRRKLRQQGKKSLVNSETSSPNANIQHYNKAIIGLTDNAATFPCIKSVQHEIIKKKKCNNNNDYQLNESVSVRDDLVDYNVISDEILYQRTATAFNESEKFNSYFNGDQKIQFIRQYIHLIDQVSLQQLEQSQWKYYHHIGMTQGIWHGRMSKQSAIKYSICHTYGRSKSVVEQRLKLIEKHLKQAQCAVEHFEKKILSECQQDIGCLYAKKELNSILYQMVQEKQQVLMCNFEHERQILIFNATDHKLLQNFFDTKPNHKHIILARRIWEATKNQMITEQDIGLLQQRLTSTALISTSNSVHELINKINQDLRTLTEVIPKTDSSSNGIEKLIRLKQDIIQKTIINNQRKIEDFHIIVQNLRDKFSIQNRFIQSNSKWNKKVFNAVETRQMHLIQHQKYIKDYNLSKTTRNQS